MGVRRRAPGVSNGGQHREFCSLRVYLDTCIYGRPFDDQRQPRVWLETMAVAVVMAGIQQGDIELVTSPALDYEHGNDPSPERRLVVGSLLRLGTVHCEITPEVMGRAAELEEDGLGPLDALHVAAAEISDADFLITCDDSLLTRARCAKVRVVSPLEFSQEARGGNP